jgi:ubiquinone/menaquinone biosynthesis C-methylase UbiE
MHKGWHLDSDIVKQKRRNWTKVWSQGYVTSCIGAFEDNYEGPIRDLWQAFFGGLPNGARVLDVATGNGAVALIAAETSRDRGLDLEIHGVDLADIDPPANVPLHQALLDTIHFHPRTAVEQTAFDDASFQGVASQYGLEYTDLEVSVPELFRLLVPGGVACFVVHHEESVVVRTARAEQADAQMLVEVDLFGRARELMEYVARAQSAEERQALATDPEAEKRRSAFNTVAGKAQSALEASPEPEFLATALSYVAEAWKTLQSGQGKTALTQLAQSGQLLESNVERLEDLLEAAQDRQAVDGICDLMKQAGFEAVSREEIRHDADRLMGWNLTARRPA